MDGTGRYPGLEWALMCQLGWNRGSYKGSRPLRMQGVGVFFLWKTFDNAKLFSACFSFK